MAYDVEPSMATLAKFRILLLALFLLGLLGTGTELLLLGHIAGWNQLTPVVLMVMSLLVLLWYAIDRGAASLRAFRMTMLLFLAAGVLGVVFHYQANLEFELEVDPDAGGMERFYEAMTGALPALAPGAMIQLGLIGLAFTFRHQVFEDLKNIRSKL
jgi:hypothetical protein